MSACAAHVETVACSPGVVTQPGWEEFPSSPMLYQVVTEVG